MEDIFKKLKCISMIVFISMCFGYFTINVFAIERDAEEIQGTKVVTRYTDVAFISDNYKIEFKNNLYINDTSGYLQNVIVSLNSRGNLPSKYNDPELYRYGKVIVNSVTYKIEAEVYTSLKTDTSPIGEIVEYTVVSEGPLME